jgi:putative ABC transport system substrate-binding protein
VDRDRKKDMKKKITVLALCAMILALCLPGEAQQTTKVPRIGFLAQSSSAEAPRLEALRQGLRDLGHVEGKNIAFEHRYADNKPDRLLALADELVRLKVDLLVVATTPAVQSAKKATRTIPIVFFGVTDPVAAGLVDSLARPGGNITGFTNIASVLSGKRLELLKETVPNLSRVAVLWNPQNPGSVPQWKESQLPGRELGLQLHSMEVSSADKFEIAFKEAIKARSAALAVTADPLANSNRKQIAGLATKNRLPAIYPWGEFVDNGGLRSYGPNFAAAGRDAARHVDKILKGAKPADLPVEQPTKFEFVINLKAAKQIGLTVPPNVLARADRVIR